ncbi:MAG TPA: diguanylate cyclase [Candidatus Baltobacteraceae bacterium]|jgi:diguanylate cyclase (GGDEF)-like protein|nr:diguanylate cyclase [Candidatus Baltobacteraceae bacterium]
MGAFAFVLVVLVSTMFPMRAVAAGEAAPRAHVCVCDATGDFAKLPYAAIPNPGLGASALHPVSVWMRVDAKNLPPGGRGAIVFPIGASSATIYIKARNGTYLPERPQRTYAIVNAIQAPIYVHVALSRPNMPYVSRIDVARRAEEAIVAWSQFFVGFFIAIGAFNLLIFAVLRDRPFLWYAGIMASILGVLLYSTPIFRAQLAEAGPFTIPFLRVVAVVAYFSCIVFFTRSFLETRRALPLIDRGLVILLPINVVVIVLNIGFDWPVTNFFDAVARNTLLVLILVAGVTKYRQGDVTARFYIVAFVGAALGITVNNLTFANPARLSTQWMIFSLEFGVAWEAIFLAAALADRTHAVALENRYLSLEKTHAEHLANVDGLTGIANRRSFDRHLQREWQLSALTGIGVALLMVDVDRFKDFNDLYGHLAGDEVLAKVARIGETCCRRDGDLFARYGGEEFAGILPGATVAEATAIAERLRSSIEEFPFGSGTGKHLTISVGVSVAASADCTLAHFIEQADAALYEAKETGRNRVCIF